MNNSATNQPASPLNDLLKRPDIWQGRQICEHFPDACSTGFKPLDKVLSSQGWPQGFLSEILYPKAGIGELRLIFPLLREQIKHGEISWVNPPFLLNSAALASADLSLEKQLIIQSSTTQDSYWAMEQMLLSDDCSVVIGWGEPADAQALRRLQLAAAEGNSYMILFRSPSAALNPSPAALRLSLQAAEKGLWITVFKQRGQSSQHPLWIDV
jgi:cell division inhibitor SulA